MLQQRPVTMIYQLNIYYFDIFSVINQLYRQMIQWQAYSQADTNIETPLRPS